MPATTSAQEVRQAVQELGAEAYHFRKRYMRTLHRSFVQTARRHPFRFAMADGRTPKVTFGKALTSTVFLARRLRVCLAEIRRWLAFCCRRRSPAR